MIYLTCCISVKNISCKLLSNFLLILLFVPTVAIAAPTKRLNTSNTSAAIANNPPQSQKPSVPPQSQKPSVPPQSQKPSVNSSEAKKPKKRREPPSDYSRAGGSRGCPKENIPLTVLAPSTFVGETISVRPTFVWFASKPQPIEFRLYQLDENTSNPRRIGDPIKLQSKSGINQLSLPQQQPALTVGTAYIWQVSIDCPDNTPFIQRAEFRVVHKPGVLDGKLSRVANNSQKAYIYAEQDLWYEALAEAFKVAPQEKQEQVVSDIMQNLAQSDSFIPEQVTPDRREVLNKEIQQRKNYLEKIAG